MKMVELKGEKMLFLAWTTVLASLVLYLVTTWARLRRIPGPFVAKFTDLQRSFWVKTGRAHEIHLDLHKRLGRLVRFGPNMISISDPDAIPIIYGFDARFKKSDLYAVLRPYTRTKVITGMITQQDEYYHKRLRKPFASIYSAMSLAPMEPLVTEPINNFLDQIEQRSAGSQEIDLGFWLQLCVWDVLCSITFGKRFGFLDRGEDIGDMLKLIFEEFKVGAPITQMPWWDYVWRKNPVRLRIMPANRMTPIVTFAMSQIKERKEQQGDKSLADKPVKDMLDRFVEALKADPETPDWALLTWTLGGLGAGGDTSVNVIRTLIYNLLANQEAQQKLEKEIRDLLGKNAEPSWKEIRTLPYLDACIKESARVRPSTGLPLERVTPAGGVVIAGEYIPEGTIVGINAWVVNRDRDVFGQDAEFWRPDRWLCPRVERAKMESTLFSFGAGHRICPGQNLFDLIVSRLIVNFVLRFKAELTHPNEPLSVENYFVVRQSGLFVKLQSK